MKIRLFATDVDGVLTDGGLYYTPDGCVVKRFNVHDGIGVRLLQLMEIEVAIITSDDSLISLGRARRLGIERVFVGVEDKLELMRELSQELQCDMDNIAYIGDDFQDLQLLKRVGLPIAVADAHPLVKSAAKYVCDLEGGEGAFRESVEWLIEELGLEIENVWYGRSSITSCWEE